MELAEHLRIWAICRSRSRISTPTPSTISTCMYYTGLDPRTMEEVYVPVNPHEKAMQRALIQYRNPKNYELVREALIKAGREDLIGYDRRCLIRPRGGERRTAGEGGGKRMEGRDSRASGKKEDHPQYP